MTEKAVIKGGGEPPQGERRRKSEILLAQKKRRRPLLVKGYLVKTRGRVCPEKGKRSFRGVARSPKVV